ncbi:uncharacterized protein LOC121800902 [Salvia splendens]|uniref:uncharacterized protein LOC121800902 n=1 Tax=Salvia splendens TaxID=180675 RepID=UPI001C26297E|nr:uncharacterized protein LOC121800902 [Salvia splendens]
MVNNLVSSQQHLQNNMQSNNDVVHKLQDAQVEHKAAMDMLMKQLSHIATSLSEMRGIEGESLPPLSHRIGLTSEDIGTKEVETREARTEDDIQTSDLGRPLPQMADPFFLDPGIEVEKEEVREETGESSKRDSSNTVKHVKPFHYRGEALKLPLFSKFIKEFIARKTKFNGKIVIGENVSAMIQKRRMPLKRTDPGMFTLPISIEDIKIEHAMCDLGASNVLPQSIYKKMSENESAESSGVLLGRPFLRTAKTIIDVFDGTICPDYHGEKFTFNIDESMKKPLDVENLHAVD